MFCCYILGDGSEPVDAFSSLGWIGADGMAGFAPCVNPDPIFGLLRPCFDAMAHHWSRIGHKMVDSMRRKRPAAFRRGRRSRIGQPEVSRALSVSDSHFEHLPGIAIVDLLAPPAYEEALRMGKPRQTTEALSVHDQTQRHHHHCQGDPPKYSVVKPTTERVDTLLSSWETTYAMEPDPPPSYEQAISNSAIAY